MTCVPFLTCTRWLILPRNSLTRSGDGRISAMHGRYVSATDTYSTSPSRNLLIRSSDMVRVFDEIPLATQLEAYAVLGAMLETLSLKKIVLLADLYRLVSID